MINWLKEIESLEGWSFGDNPQMADHIAEKTKAGLNTATCSLYVEAKELPCVGKRSYINNSSGSPVCVIEITSVKCIPFSEVDEDFALAEGYKDLQQWRLDHTAFFKRKKHDFSENTLVVCRQFKVIHIF